MYFFFFSSRRRHTRFDCDWSSDVCSSDLRSTGVGASATRGSPCCYRRNARTSRFASPTRRSVRCSSSGDVRRRGALLDPQLREVLPERRAHHLLERHAVLLRGADDAALDRWLDPHVHPPTFWIRRSADSPLFVGGQHFHQKTSTRDRLGIASRIFAPGAPPHNWVKPPDERGEIPENTTAQAIRRPSEEAKKTSLSVRSVKRRRAATASRSSAPPLATSAGPPP